MRGERTGSQASSSAPPAPQVALLQAAGCTAAAPVASGGGSGGSAGGKPPCRGRVPTALQCLDAHPQRPRSKGRAGKSEQW